MSRGAPLSSVTVGVLKALLKLSLLAMALAVVAAVVSITRAAAPTPVSYDAWPDVPAKPTA